MTKDKLNQAKTELEDFSNQLGIAAGLSRILAISLEFGSNISKLDIISLAYALKLILQTQKYKIGEIRKNLFDA